MKFAKGMFPTCSSTAPFEKECSFLFLETLEDATQYFEINSIIKSKQSVGFWFGLKSQPSHFRRSAMDYVAHEVGSGNVMARVLATKMDLSDKQTSIVDFCTYSDNIILELHKSIFKFINNGSVVRINEIGGVCPINEISDEYTYVVEINQKQMENFILHKKINVDFKINKESIVIENDFSADYVVKDFCKFTGINEKDVQGIGYFKMKTLLFKTVDFVNFFDAGIKQGLKNVSFETTGQDQSQIQALKQIFESLMFKHKDKHITFYVKTPLWNKERLKTKAKNISIKYFKD